MTTSRPRMYQPIWEALKKHKTVTINAPAKLHRRIVRAVSKEKWMDLAYKQREGWRMEWLTYSINKEQNQITFRLSYRLTELLPGEF